MVLNPTAIMVFASPGPSAEHIAIASMMQGIVFNSEGKYNVCILENGHELKTFTFNVLK